VYVAARGRARDTSGLRLRLSDHARARAVTVTARPDALARPGRGGAGAGPNERHRPPGARRRRSDQCCWLVVPLAVPIALSAHGADRHCSESTVVSCSLAEHRGRSAVSSTFCGPPACVVRGSRPYGCADLAEILFLMPDSGIRCRLVNALARSSQQLTLRTRSRSVPPPAHGEMAGRLRRPLVGSAETSAGHLRSSDRSTMPRTPGLRGVFRH